MENGLWLFRLSIEEGGNPRSKICPLVDVQKINEYRGNISPLEAEEESKLQNNDEEYISFLKKELFEHGRLRQGWGYKYEDMDLDLNQPGNIWIENYIMLGWRVGWGKIPRKNACGRWNILKLMKDMRIGDIVFIPRIRDEDKFTVATVDKRKYFFQPMKEYFGHAHVVGVKNIKEYSYDNHFAPKIFVPYQRAVCEIKKGHQNFKTLSNFINKYYI